MMQSILVTLLVGFVLSFSARTIAQPLSTTIPVSNAAALPSAAANNGKVRMVWDGISPSDCSVGGGTTQVFCQSDGSSWLPYAGGGLPVVGENVVTPTSLGLSTCEEIVAAINASGTPPTTLRLDSTITAAACTVTANIMIQCQGGTIDTNQTANALIHLGPVNCEPGQQWITDFASNSISFSGNTTLDKVSSGWWGYSSLDDTPNIIAALSALSSGGHLFIPAGIHKATNISLSGMSNITISGAGPATVLDNSTKNTRVFNVVNAENIVIQDMAFTGDFTTGTGGARANTGQGAVFANNTGAQVSRNITLKNLLFRDLAGDAIRIGPSGQNWIISDCQMYNGLGFVELSGVDTGGDVRPINGVTISGFTVVGSPSTSRTAIGGTTITGSDDLIDMSGGIYNVTISDGTFDLRGGSAINTIGNRAILVGISSPTNGVVRNVTISDLTIYRANNANLATQSDSGAISIIDNSGGNVQGVSISTVSIYDALNGISVKNLIHPVTITGNNCYSCYEGIYLSVAAGTQVIGNTIVNPTKYGIFVQGNDIQIKNNTIRDATTASAEGIRATTGDDTQIISNNIVGGVASGYSLRIIGTKTRVPVQDNTITDQPGTAISIESPVVNTQLIRNVLANNGVNIADTGVGTFYDSMTPLATETIAAGATIKANACGGTKPINATGAQTTNTTNTFTAPDASNDRCEMMVCNVDSADTITLDRNSNFLTIAGTDTALAAGECVLVGRVGAVWRELAPKTTAS